LMSAQLSLTIDWAKLDDTALSASADLAGCKVVKSPSRLSAEALEGAFIHRVPVGDGWSGYLLGPGNPDFVPLAEISPHLVRSVIYTEDPTFYEHQGFSGDFQGALVRNLKEGRIGWGGSSITNQMVKNVFLTRDKTLARKLQEFILTWHVENAISKERILEIYFNAIEYGPGLYGIGRAADLYFKRTPRRLGVIESAFISTLLPAPAVRYQQYCRRAHTLWTQQKIENIVDGMWTRELIDEEAYLLAIEAPLYFRGDPASEPMCAGKVRK
ncbi:MAG: transglycosylase domain-containing protein, partial [Deltaproteobacteria bacterium]|nr:transglycosylase domain-containing protein [Deltaproteobacteria bacterium]